MLWLVRCFARAHVTTPYAQVEYCTAERPTASLRGSSEQYVRVLQDFKERCAKLLWEYNVRVLGNCRFAGWKSSNQLQTTAVRPRIGACEVRNKA